MRTADRVLAVVLAVILLGLGVLIPIEIVRSTAFGMSGYLALPYQSGADYLASHQWQDTVIMVICAGIAVVGLVLLLAELKPRRPGLLAMSGGDGAVAVISRRSVGRALSRAATSVPSVAEARARVTGRRATVWVRTRLPDPGELETQVNEQLTASLAELDLVRPPRLRLRLRRVKE